MRKALFLSPLMLIFLAACSPQAYQVNPTPNIAENPNEVPESQQEDYMRIIGDLRWDSLTGKREWKSKFSDCLSDDNPSTRQTKNISGKKVEWMAMGDKSDYLHNNFILNSSFAFDTSSGPVYKVRQDIRKCRVTYGGVEMNIESVEFTQNTSSASKTMTSRIVFSPYEVSPARALKAAIAQKYDLTTQGYCSKFTCWDLGDINQPGSISATPTPYSVSLLDKINVNKSDL